MLSRGGRAWCWTGLFFLAALFTWHGRAQAQPRPSSDLLLPYFEVGLSDAGVTTLLAVSNDLGRPADVLVTVSSNWGVPVLSVPLRLKAHEIWTADLRDWFVSGKVPGVTLSAADLLHLQAALSGEPSPRDGLYYSTAVAADRASGSISLRTLGSPRPAALEGQFFLIDPGQGASQGESLADVSAAAAPVESCTQHTVRQIAGGAPGGSRLALWIDAGSQPLPAPNPQDRRLAVAVSAYSANGALLKRQTVKLLPASGIAVSTLGLNQALGRLELATQSRSVVGIRAAGNAVWTATCAQGPPPSPQPKIQVVTLVNGKRATSPPGPSIAVGAPVAWTYTVTNAGAGNLNQVRVTDSVAGIVKCPQKTLKPGQSMACTRSGVAEGCQHTSAITAVATGANRTPVSAKDSASYFGDDGSEIDITVSTNGQDADTPPGPSVQAGSPVSWTYQVVNTGTIRLYQIVVQDDQGVAVSCPRVSLAPGEVMTCTAGGSAVAGQYSNVGKVTATGTCGKVTASNPSHYFGESSLGLDLQTLTNGFDADSPPGPSIAVGNPVTWQYVVTNTGKLTVSNATVTDDHGIAVSCPLNVLQPGQSMTCIARGVAAPCQYSNLGTATGTTSEGPVTASDASNYLGQSQSSLTLRTFVNGQAADQPPGPTVVTGSALQWTYTVTNTGQVALTGLKIADDRGLTVTCPQDPLPPGQSATCAAAGTALSGSYVSRGVVSGTNPCGSTVTASDAATYVGAGDSGLQIQTLVNGQNANTPPGPSIGVGGAVAWSYTVTNTGQISLSRVTVSDSLGNFITCPQTTLQAGATMTCSSQGTAQACQASDLGTATAQTPAGQTVTAIDPAYYFGQGQPALQIQVATNGVSASAAPGPTIQVGSVVTWTYTVVNAGDVPLTQIQVGDDQGVVVSCPAATLAAGESMRCTARGTAADGQYHNTATATGAPPCGTQVSAQAGGYYFGAGDGAIQLRKLTAGQATPTAPGPSIPIGSPVTWTYVVTNSGRTALSGVGVTDNRGVVVTCPKSTLQPGESMSCLGTGTAQACQYDNLGTATGKTASGQQVNGVDQGFYFGQIRATVSLRLTVNGQAAPTAPGPTLPVGSTVAWAYLVTNPGNAPLSSVRVIDGRGAAVTCPQTGLQPGEQMTCTAASVAAEGQFDDTAVVAATSPCGDAVTAQDDGHYFGRGTSGLQIQTLLNGQAAPSPGPSLTVGAPILWSYTVSNVGQTGLSGIAVTDDRGSIVSCQRTSLQPGESTSCTAINRDAAQACTQVNVGKAAAQGGGGAITAFGPAYYVGQGQPALQIQVAANGVAASAAPGPAIQVGSAVTWTYTVVNTGNVSLSQVQVNDDHGVAVSCPVAALAPGESMRCTADGIAVDGQYHNTGTVTGAPPCGAQVSAQAGSYYFGAGDGAIQLRKLTAGQATPTAPGPTLPLGSPVTWTYVVTNSGRAALSGVGVTDNQGVVVTCPKSTLQSGESMSCTGAGTAQACQYDNLGIATGKTPSGQQVNGVDQGFYFGQIRTGLTLRMTVNGQAAPTAPGPTLPVGSTVAWAYLVTNSGNVPLSSVRVTDGRGAAVTCPQTSLQPGAQMTCTATGIAVEGQFDDTAAVAATSPCDDAVTAQDAGHYLGRGTPGLQIQTLLNGQDLPSPGPSLTVGTPILWSYTVSNVGQASLSSLVVTDGRGSNVTCQRTSLQPGDSTACTAAGQDTVQACTQVNLGKATAQGSAGPITAFDPGFYVGQFQATLQMQVTVNGVRATAAPGPSIAVGAPVTWAYRATNTGNVPLTNVQILDSQGAAVGSCAPNGTTLNPGQTMTCTAPGRAVGGQFQTTGTVTADPPCGSPVSAQDTSYYFGQTATIQIRKLLNGQHVDAAPGPSLTPGSTIAWSYIVSNPGSVALQSVVVGDDKGVAVTCPGTSLQPGASMVCTGSSVSQTCPYHNVGTATGVATGGVTVTASDSSYYSGSFQAGIQIETSVNGNPADTPPGLPVRLGSTVSWTYKVTNGGTVALSGIQVTDDTGVTVSCPQASLQPGGSMTCTASGTAAPGLHRNTGTVTGTTPCGSTVSASDSGYYSVPQLEFAGTSGFFFIWNDQGSGANLNGIFYRPVPPPGYFILGDYGEQVPNYNTGPSGTVLTVRVGAYDDPQSPALLPPVDFIGVWQATFIPGIFSLKQVSIWAQVPPSGYVCSGFVFQAGWGKPNIADPAFSPGLDKLRCLRSDLATQVDLFGLVWNNVGGLGPDISVYRVPKLNIVYAIPNFNPPTVRAWVPVGLP